MEYTSLYGIVKMKTGHQIMPIMCSKKESAPYAKVISQIVLFASAKTLPIQKKWKLTLKLNLTNTSLSPMVQAW